MRYVEFFQSCQDCKSDVPSLGVEKNLTPEIIRLIGGGADDMFPDIIPSVQSNTFIGTISTV